MSMPPTDPHGHGHGDSDGAAGTAGYDDARVDDHVPVSPLLSDDPPKIGDFWLDARLGAVAAGVAYTGHDEAQRPAVVVLLSAGASADPAARDRLAGMVNSLHIDQVYARGGQGQDYGRHARRFRPEAGGPVSPDGRAAAGWVALAYDGSPAAAAQAMRILDEVQLASLPAQGSPAGPDYHHYWVDRVKPGLARLWPLPWPGRYDRAGWQTILVSWLLMMLLAALAILTAILIFHNQPPQTPPSPTGGSGSPPPQSGSPSPQSGSPSPQSGSPSPQSGSPSPQSGSPSPSRSASASPSGSPSSGSPSPSGSQTGGGSPTPDESASAGGSSPGSRL